MMASKNFIQSNIREIAEYTKSDVLQIESHTKKLFFKMSCKTTNLSGKSIFQKPEIMHIDVGSAIGCGQRPLQIHLRQRNQVNKAFRITKTSCFLFRVFRGLFQGCGLQSDEFVFYILSDNFHTRHGYSTITE